jgi:hypothetical protein
LLVAAFEFESEASIGWFMAFSCDYVFNW